MKLISILNQKNRILYQITVSNIISILLFLGLYTMYIIIYKKNSIYTMESIYLLYIYIYLFIILCANSITIFNIEVYSGTWTLLRLTKVPTYMYILYIFNYCFLSLILIPYFLIILLYINTVNYIDTIDTNVDIIMLYLLYNIVNLIILSIYNIMDNKNIIYISTIPIFIIYIIIRQIVIQDELLIPAAELLIWIAILFIFVCLLVKFIVVKIRYRIK